MDSATQNKILTQARSLIGTSYDQLDCSHFVNKAFSKAGLPYDYRNSTSFSVDPDDHFEFIGADLKADALEPGDIIVFNGHMGIWDPDGCKTLGGNQQCQKLNSDAPFLSSRSGGNRGPDYGKIKWWKGHYKVYRWTEPAAPNDQN